MAPPSPPNRSQCLSKICPDHPQAKLPPTPPFIFSLALHLLDERITVFVVVQSLSRVQLFATPWTAAHQASLSFISQSLLKLMSTESVMPSNHLVLCRPLLLPSVFLSIRAFYHSLIITFFFFFLAMPCSMWDLSSPTRNQTCAPCILPWKYGVSATGSPRKYLPYFFITDLFA